ncbi:hypothetical protein K0M31_016093 [Melipona bicolor]|uniref:Uncharacterized protein n=1 Tax=Melipona bicolor TaxID=60889 RepID=A0AA40KTE1_9HYME|nr:hypothetical protein K0M31_016093 [Melipona bicolor]
MSSTLHAPISKDSCDSGSFCGGEAVVVRYDVMELMLWLEEDSHQLACHMVKGLLIVHAIKI